MWPLTTPARTTCKHFLAVTNRIQAFSNQTSEIVRPTRSSGSKAKHQVERLTDVEEARVTAVVRLSREPARDSAIHVLRPRVCKSEVGLLHVTHDDVILAHQ
jgi:hypothetical protein